MKKVLGASIIILACMARPQNAGAATNQPFVFLDLRAAANRGFADEVAGDGKGGWSDYGRNCMSALPTGITDFDKRLVPFTILDPAQNNGAAIMVLSGPTREQAFPPASREIAVNQKLAALYFLHTTMYVKKEAAATNAPLVRYVIHYADGSEARFEARNGHDIYDWYGTPQRMPNALRYYSEKWFHLCVAPWKNPQPDKPIQWLRAESTGNAIPLIIAITGATDLRTYHAFVAEATKRIEYVTQPAQKANPARFKIGTGIVATNPPRFGVNTELGGFGTWSPGREINAWVRDGMFECSDLQYNGEVLDGGDDWLCDPFSTPKQGGKYGYRAGTSFWEFMYDGFFDGADIRIYRIDRANNMLKLVRTGKVKTFHGSTNSDYRITLDQKGVPIQKGDLYVLNHTVPDLRKGVTRDMVRRPSWMLTCEGPQNMGQDPPDAPVCMGIDTNTYCPAGGSRASLRLDVRTDAAVIKGGAYDLKDKKGIWAWYLGKQDIYTAALRSGAVYHVSVWARQTGIADGQFTVDFEGLGQQTFTAGKEWKKHTFAFTGGVPKTKNPVQPSRIFVYTFKKGTLWLDNLVVNEAEVSPFAFFPEIMAQLKEWKPATLRIWRSGHSATLDQMLVPLAQERGLWTSKKMGTPGGVSLHELLALSKEVGADPWLVFNPFLPERDWPRLMEYLAGPPDSPMGAVRARLGQREPWTKTFKTIHLEICNEPWNRIFTPWAWPERPEVYGPIANYAFGKMKESAQYAAQPDKFSFVIGGFALQTGPGSWTAEIGNHCPNAKAVGTAMYVGGWDGFDLGGNNDDQLFFNLLFYNPRVLKGPMEDLAKVYANRRVTAQPLRLFTYEGGPGYGMPAAGRPYNLDGEKIGKSMAMAIAVLDNYMEKIPLGFTIQNYYKYAHGANWASHTRFPDYRPHADWLALQLRNQYLAGDLMTVTEKQCDTINLPAMTAQRESGRDAKGKPVYTTVKLPECENIETIKCFPFKQGKRWSFMLYSLQLKAPTQVTLDVPYEPAPAVEVCSLSAANPRASNRETMAVAIKKETRADFARSYTVTLPPFSVVVLVNHEQ